VTIDQCWLDWPSKLTENIVTRHCPEYRRLWLFPYKRVALLQFCCMSCLYHHTASWHRLDVRARSTKKTSWLRGTSTYTRLFSTINGVRRYNVKAKLTTCCSVANRARLVNLYFFSFSFPLLAISPRLPSRSSPNVTERWQIGCNRKVKLFFLNSVRGGRDVQKGHFRFG